MIDYQTNEINITIWNAVIKSVEAGNSAPYKTARELKELFKEFFDPEFTRRQNEMAQRRRRELSEKRAILEAAGRIQN